MGGSDIGNNLLTGTISEASFFECKSVAVFDIPNNFITGTIPHSVGFMTNLNNLYVPARFPSSSPREGLPVSRAQGVGFGN